MNLPITSNPQVKMLLEFYHDSVKGLLTQEQLVSACHYWAYENAFQDMVFRPYPSEPHDLMEWKHMSLRQKEAVPDEVRSRMEKMFTGFYDLYHSIRNANRSTLTYLLEMEKTFLKYDTAKTEHVRTRIVDFKSKGVTPW